MKRIFNEALAISDVNPDPGKEEVVVFQGRFQPPTVAHLGIIEKAYKKYKKPVVIAVVRGAKSDPAKNPFPFDLQKKMIDSALSFPHEVIQLTTGFIGDFISPLRDQGKEPVILFAGSDRVKSYQGQIKRYQDQLNLSLEVEEIPRTDEDVSATKVRDALANDDEETFKKMMNSKTYKYYKELMTYV